MHDRDLDVRVALAMGWTCKRVPYSMFQPDYLVDVWHAPDGSMLYASPIMAEPPPFSQSLDAVKLVEVEVERRGLQEKYARALVLVALGQDGLTRHEMRGLWNDQLWLLVTATPLQRCQAAVIVLEEAADAPR